MWRYTLNFCFVKHPNVTSHMLLSRHSHDLCFQLFTILQLSGSKAHLQAVNYSNDSNFLSFGSLHNADNSFKESFKPLLLSFFMLKFLKLFAFCNLHSAIYILLCFICFLPGNWSINSIKLSDELSCNLA